MVTEQLRNITDIYGIVSIIQLEWNIFQQTVLKQLKFQETFCVVI